MNGKSAMSEEKLDDAVEGPLLTHDFKVNNSGSLELVGAHDRNPIKIKDFDDIYKRPEEETTMFGVAKRCLKRKIDKLSVTRIVLANFPILGTLKRYKIKQDLPSDIIAGLTAGVMMIPQGMAFAHLSTLPPIVGLYISLFSSVVYIFMGMGHQLSWGCIAILSIMMGSILDKYDQKIQDSMKTSSCNSDLTELLNSTSVWQSSSTPLPVSLSVEKRIEVAAAVTLICGLILSVLGKLGFAKLTTYMSDSLVTGFTVAASCHVATSQLKSTFGLNFLPRHNGMFQLIKVWVDFLGNIHKSNPATVIMTFTCILIIYLVKRFINEKYQKKIKIPIPIELIVLVIATVVNSQTKLNEKFSFSIVRDVPVGIPSPKIPDMSLAKDYIVDGMVIIIVAFAQNIALAKLFAIKHKYKVNADQEMFANGVICVVCSLFSGFIAGASVSRSLVQDGAGGKTQVASAFAAGVVLLVVMLLGPYFYYLPTCVLAAVILVNLYAMFLKLLTIPDLWRKSKTDCLMWVITFLAVVIIDPAMGLLVGIISSIMLVLIQSQIDSVDVTAWVAVGNYNVWRAKENYFCTQDVHDVRVVRVNGPLYFANAEIVTNNIFKKSGKNPARMRRKQAEMHKAANSVGSAGGKEINIHQPDETIKDIAETDFNHTYVLKDEDHPTGNEVKQDMPVVVDLNKLPAVEIKNGDAKEEEAAKGSSDLTATVIVPSMIAISALAFADYLLTLAPMCGPRPELIVKLCAVAMIVTLMVINCKSNDVAAPVQVICTILKILALLVIVFGGVIRMAQGWTAELRQGFDNSTKESVNIALAFYSINYSYAGWSNVFTIFEEVKNPKRNLLACSGVGLLVVTLLYIMANISFITVLSRKEMMTSSAVAVDWADVVLGSASTIMLLPIAVSTFGAAVSSLFTGSRIIFAAGRDNVMPEWLSFLHVNNLSPVPAILFTGILAIIFVIPGGISNIINFLMFPMNILDFLSTTVLFVFRKTKPNAPRIIKVPLLVPCLVLAYTLFLLVTPLVLNPRMEFLYATCFVVAGVLFYVPFIHCAFRINKLDGAVAKLQLLLQVSPATYSKLQ